MDIGKKLLWLRKKANTTQSEIAKKIGVSKSAYSQYENNVRIPDYKKIKKICEIFESNMDFIFDDMYGYESEIDENINIGKNINGQLMQCIYRANWIIGLIDNEIGEPEAGENIFSYISELEYLFGQIKEYKERQSYFITVEGIEDEIIEYIRKYRK